MRKILIDPITRLEGHGKITILVNDEGNCERAFFQVPEFRGFEKFCEGRAAEEMPRITPRICGVCPTAHHMASTKALDDLFKVEPTPTAKKIRELIYSTFMVEDHALHFYILGGPDFVMGPDAPAAERNILGVLQKVGLEVGKKVILTRKALRDIISYFGGKVIHPVFGLPGGVSKGLAKEKRKEFLEIAKQAVEFGQFSLQLFNDVVLKNKAYVDLVVGDIYKHKTYYMGLVDENKKVNFYDGKLRVVTPSGKEFAYFDIHNYLDIIDEHVEEWTYIKQPYLKKVGWKGYIDGEESGIYRVAPLARLNAAEGLTTPLAEEQAQKMFETLGGKPAHNTLAFHWARLIELLYAAERMVELLEDDSICSDDIRNIPTEKPEEGIGVVEAPRGVLIHHYKTDEKGIIQKANLIVATIHNAAAIFMSIEKAAKALVKNGKADDGILNMVEMAFRAYDPCLACATHSVPGKMPLEINLINKNTKKIIQTLKR